MYAAKEMGRNCVRMFNAVLQHEPESRTRALDLRLVWHSAYRCGEASVDREHKDLFVQANAMIKAAMEGDGDLKQSPALLDELISSVAIHFSNEEAVLGRYCYADLEGHVLKHQRLVGRALELRSMAEAGELTLGDLVTFLAQEVVAKHMLQEDTKFFPLLRDAMNLERRKLAIKPHVH
jgi:hemerythrin-like metal-binding protein